MTMNNYNNQQKISIQNSNRKRMNSRHLINKISILMLIKIQKKIKQSINSF